jgi:hypothetical protein
MHVALAADRPAVALLVGQPGAGASSVAVAAAHELRPAFPDGVFRVDLRGLEPGMRLDTAAVVELVARAVDFHLDSALQSDQQRRAALAAELDRRRVLLVLDHAKDEQHVAPLVSPPIAEGIIVTSRSRSQNYVGQDLFFGVPPLSRRAAVRLLAMFAGNRPHSRRQLARLARLCARLPLALRVAGRQIQSGLPGNLDILINERKRARLDDVVRTAIKLSYDGLEDPSVQREFRLLSAAAGCAGTPAEMAYITDEPGPHEHQQRLQKLVGHCLARDTPYASADDLGATYWLYDLVSDFAREELAREIPASAIRHLERNSVTFLRDRLREITTRSRPADAADLLNPARYRAAERVADERGWPGLAADLADGLYVLFLARGEEDTAAAINDRLVRRFIAHGNYPAAAAACLTAAQRLDERGAIQPAVDAATWAVEIAREHGLHADFERAEVRLSELRSGSLG